MEAIALVVCVLFAALPARPAFAELLRIEVDAGAGTGGLAWTPGITQRSAHQIPVPGYQRDASQVGNHCIGYIGDAPTLTVVLRAATQAEVTVESQADPVIVMVGPGGQVFCNDDYHGLNPGLLETFEAGTWDIYVGSYGPADPISFELILH